MESDSKITIERLHNHSGLYGNIGYLIQRCLVAMCDFEEISFTDVYREQNRVADVFAKCAMS